MKRARDSAEWKTFMHELSKQGFEILPRIGNPIPLHKIGEPYSLSSVWWVFFRRKGGRFTKKQNQGMEFMRALGLKVFKYPPEAKT